MKMKKRLFGILLSLVLMLGLLPGMTAYADGTTYNPASTYTGFGDLITNDTEVTISEVSGKTWYVIACDASTVTLLSKSGFGNHVFNSDTSVGNVYANSEIKTYVDGLTGEGQPLAVISSVISDLTLIDTLTAEGLSETKRKGAGGEWWLSSPGDDDDLAAFVDSYGDVNQNYVDYEGYGVRPALKLDLSKVTFDSESKTFSVNETQQQSSGTDVLTRKDTGITGTNYGAWSGVTKSSGAIYAGNSAGGNESIQLRSNNNNSGIVTTTSGGKATKVSVKWNNYTTNGRTLNVYGKNSAYSAASDLYGNDRGDLLGTIVYGQSTE